jgi:hypothetical protein
LSDGVIRGCYKVSGGDLRIGTDCTSKEKPLAWNAQGPKGDTGARGPKGEAGDDGQRGPKGNDGAKGDKGNPGATGATGAKGEPGAPGQNGQNGHDGAPGVGGLSGYQVLTAQTQSNFTSTGYFLSGDSPSCPAGKVLVGGGGKASYKGGTIGPTLSASYPNGDHWTVETTSPNDVSFHTDVVVDAYAICVTGS